MIKKFTEASVHGRFQPPHLGHLEYILEAKKRCSYLWIGITRFDLNEKIECAKAKHREEQFNNPLTYFERVKLITEMLENSGVDKSEFGFVPFPIDHPEKLPNFLPKRVPCFTTIYDKWNEEKIKILKKNGYKTIVLWKRSKKKYVGKSVRNSIFEGENKWKKMVPEILVSKIEDMNLKKRLKELSA